MKTKLTLFLLLYSANLAIGGNSGEFLGDLILYPENCQNTDSRICRLGAELTYKSSRNRLVWQTDKWKGDEYESGTTDGASIPKWAQPIIGDPYDESYLKAAILHDHYCFKENHVRTWRETHLMFYDALIDLGVEPVKAKTMYFAVYLFGPHWVKLVPGEYCGENCVKFHFNMLAQTYQNDHFYKNYALGKNTYMKWNGDRLSSNKSQDQINKFKRKLDFNPDLTIEEIQEYAKDLEPNNFFLNNGATYTPSGLEDKNIIPK